MGSMIASTLTWSALEKVGDSTQAIIQAIWYSALLFGLIAIATATQQAIALGRLCCYPDGLDKLRNLLGWQDHGHRKPQRLQLFMWQTPIAMLNASVYTFILGLAILVWSSAAVGWPTYKPEV